MSEDIGRVFDADYLSPLIGYFLFPDFLQSFLPIPVTMLNRSLALERVFVQQIDYLAIGEPNVLRLAYLDHWDAAGLMPALLFNTTEVNTGRRRVVSPFTFPSKEISFLPVWGGAGSIAPSLATAAIVSARFPWLTPSAWFEEVFKGSDEKAGAPSRIRLVDGGYFENSGVSTAHDLIRALDQEARRVGVANDVEIFLLVLVSPDSDIAGGADPFTDVLDPIRTMLNTRAARARAAVERAEEELGVYRRENGKVRRRVDDFHSSNLACPYRWDGKYRA